MLPFHPTRVNTVFPLHLPNMSAIAQNKWIDFWTQIFVLQRNLSNEDIAFPYQIKDGWQNGLSMKKDNFFQVASLIVTYLIVAIQFQQSNNTPGNVTGI